MRKNNRTELYYACPCGRPYRLRYHFLKLGEITKSLQDWAKEFKMNPHTLYRRMREGQTPKKALEINGGRITQLKEQGER